MFRIPLVLATLSLAATASASSSHNSRFGRADVRTAFGPRLLTDDLNPMFGARIDHRFQDKITGNFTAGATADWGANVDGGTVSLGLDLHPFGGGLAGPWMGPRLTGNFRDRGVELNAKLLWGYGYTMEPGILLGFGAGPGLRVDPIEGTSALTPAGEVVLSMAFK